jgi:mono/diheme cytochrome c family protein
VNLSFPGDLHQNHQRGTGQTDILDHQKWFAGNRNEQLRKFYFAFASGFNEGENMIGKDMYEKVFNKMSTSILFIWLLMLLGFPSSLFAAGECPQTRQTPTAPKNFLTMQNPLSLNAKTLKAGEDLFQIQGKPITCKTCHGINGDGKGDSSFESTPPARNFTCAETMGALPGGQLFWIIRNGSPNTSMFGFSDLSDNQIWQLVHYIRQFSKK